MVEIEHRGWEHFGEAGGDRRDRNDRGWRGVIRQFAVVCWPSVAWWGEAQLTPR